MTPDRETERHRERRLSCVPPDPVGSYHGTIIMRALGPPRMVPWYYYNARPGPLGSYYGTIIMPTQTP
eukprot:7251075-Ditylum_brightwellii.AAC.1